MGGKKIQKIKKFCEHSGSNSKCIHQGEQNKANPYNCKPQFKVGGGD